MLGTHYSHQNKPHTTPYVKLSQTDPARPPPDQAIPRKKGPYHTHTATVEASTAELELPTHLSMRVPSAATS